MINERTSGMMNILDHPSDISDSGSSGFGDFLKEDIDEDSQDMKLNLMKWSNRLEIESIDLKEKSEIILEKMGLIMKRLEKCQDSLAATSQDYKKILKLMARQFPNHLRTSSIIQEISYRQMNAAKNDMIEVKDTQPPLTQTTNSSSKSNLSLGNTSKISESTALENNQTDSRILLNRIEGMEKLQETVLHTLMSLQASMNSQQGLNEGTEKRHNNSSTPQNQPTTEQDSPLSTVVSTRNHRAVGGIFSSPSPSPNGTFKKSTPPVKAQERKSLIIGEPDISPPACKRLCKSGET